jgi:flavin-binding protein dodecin
MGFCFVHYTADLAALQTKFRGLAGGTCPGSMLCGHRARPGDALPHRSNAIIKLVVAALLRPPCLDRMKACAEFDSATKPTFMIQFGEGIGPMAKKQSESVYRIVDVVGVSEKSWEDAGRRAVETAASSLRDLRVAEVTKMDMKVENGKVTAFRTRVALSFKYEG